MLYNSYDLSGPAYPLVRARYVKKSSARYNIEKKRRRRRNDRDKKKETKGFHFHFISLHIYIYEDCRKVTYNLVKAALLGNDGKCTG